MTKDHKVRICLGRLHGMERQQKMIFLLKHPKAIDAVLKQKLGMGLIGSGVRGPRFNAK